MSSRRLKPAEHYLSDHQRPAKPQFVHILLAVVDDLQTARIRLSELASLAAGEYFVFDSRTHQIVAAVLH